MRPYRNLFLVIYHHYSFTSEYILQVSNKLCIYRLAKIAYSHYNAADEAFFALKIVIAFEADAF